MLLNFLIWINKRKLDKMITEDYSYEEILKQSQKIVFSNQLSKTDLHHIETFAILRLEVI